MSIRSKCLAIFLVLPGLSIFGQEIVPASTPEPPAIPGVLPPRDDSLSKQQLEAGRLLLDGIQAAENGRKLAAQNQYAEAEPLFRRALEIQRKIGNDPLALAQLVDEEARAERIVAAP